MALKAVIGKIEDVVEALRGFYKQQGDKFVLDLEGDVPGFVASSAHEDIKRSLTEFRDNNIKILKDLERFKDIDPDAARKALDEIGKLEKKGVKGADGVDAIIQAALAPVMKQVTDLTTALQAKDAEASRAAMDSKLTEAFVAAGARRSAIPDLLARASGRFKLIDGVPVVMNGETPVFSTANPGVRKSVAEWATELSAGAGAHLFEPSKGSGAQSTGDGGAKAEKTIAFDQRDFLSNLDGIASGKVAVQSSL
jgi:hypothetical protein